MSGSGRAARPATRDVEVHRGPTASVWQGRSDGRVVAVKVLHPEAGRRARRRLLAQVRRVRAVDHRRVLAPLAVHRGRSGGATVWPWIDGRDLSGRLARHGRPEAVWATAIVEELDGVVGSLHERGVTHGRLTPDHVLLDHEGRPVLIGIDPFADSGVDAQAADRSAVEAISALLAGGTPQRAAEEPIDAAGGPALVAGGGRSRGRHRAATPVAAGLAVVLTGAVVALGRAGAAPECPASREDAGLHADVDGDGCDDSLDWSTATGRLVARTATGSRAWRLGEPGDLFVLGDWDCDGVLTPGLRRAGADRTYGFDRWPTAGTSSARPVDDPPRCALDP